MDLYIPELRLDVEIDGAAYYHPDEQKDIDNTLALQEAGVTVFRIRAQPLKLLSYYFQFNEVSVKKVRVKDAPQILEIILDWISRTYGFQPRLQPLAKEYQCSNPDFSCGKRGPASLFAYPGKCLDCYRYCPGYGGSPHLADIVSNGLCGKCYNRKRVAEPADMCDGYGEQPPHLAAINADRLCNKCYYRKRVAEPTDMCDGYGEQPPHLAAINADRLCGKCYMRKRRLTGKTETKLRRFYRKI